LLGTLNEKRNRATRPHLREEVRRPTDRQSVIGSQSLDHRVNSFQSSRMGERYEGSHSDPLVW